MRPDQQFEALTKQMQREAQIAAGIETLAGLAILALMIWAAIWTIQVVRRWEQRDEAKLKALQRIAAGLAPQQRPHKSSSNIDPDIRAD